MVMSDGILTPPSPLEQSLGRLTRRIVDEIGEAIVTGAFEANTILPVEAEMVERFGASRSVLREAIKVLNAKGLVTAKPRRGTSVTPSTSWNLFDPDVLRWTLKRNFSLDLLIQFTHVRIGVEPHATRLAAMHADSEDLAAIESGFRRMEAASMGEDDELLADIAFHLAILDASHNIFFAKLKPLVETALHFSIRYTDGIARDEAVKLKRHQDVYDTIRLGKPEPAAKASLRLLTDALEIMENGLNASPDQEAKVAL